MGEREKLDFGREREARFWEREREARFGERQRETRFGERQREARFGEKEKKNYHTIKSNDVWWRKPLQNHQTGFQTFSMGV